MNTNYFKYVLEVINMTYIVVFLVGFGIGFAANKYNLIEKIKEKLSKRGK
jgi:hypothetical protein